MATIPVYMQGQDANLYNDELSKTLQQSLSDNGWTLPQQTTTNITNVSGQMPDGAMWYDTSSNEMKVKINGTVKVVTVS